MDWTALKLSFELAGLTCIILLPIAVVTARWLSSSDFKGKVAVEALLALPLVLPPTVLGYYILEHIGGASSFGRWYTALVGKPLAFSFAGLVFASFIVNIPFAMLPIQRAFEAIPRDLRLAAPTCGLSPLQSLLKIELPLAWPGVLSALVLTVTHTLGEFGVVLMVGGNIPGETRTIAIAIYDQVQAFDTVGAGRMAGTLLAISFAALLSTAWLNNKAVSLS